MTSSALLRVPAPSWQVVLQPDTDAKDITRVLSPRLVSLSVTCEMDDTADQLDIVLSNADGRLQMPPTGAVLAVKVGWNEAALTLLGHFSVDELELSNAPSRLHITGRAADVSSDWQEKKERSFDGVTLGTLAKVIAQDHSLPLSITPTLAKQALGHVDQTNESDLNLLTRLAKTYGATATVKASQLLVVPAGGDKSVSGKPLPAITIAQTDAKHWRWSTKDRSKYTGVTTRWHDLNAANTLSLTAGEPGSTLVLETVYPTQDEAVAAAVAKLAELRRAGGKLSMTLPKGDVRRQPGAHCALSGFHPLIDAGQWQIDKVTHKLDQNGYSQGLTLTSEEDES